MISWMALAIRTWNGEAIAIKGKEVSSKEKTDEQF